MPDNSESGFFDSSFGQCTDVSRLRRPYRRLQNSYADVLLYTDPTFRHLTQTAADHAIRNILITAVNVPARSKALQNLVAAISQTRHNVTFHPVPLLPDKGKFQNINAGLDHLNLTPFDWLLVIDDDVALPNHFLNNFLYIAESANFHLCQPAHTIHSHNSYLLTRRHPHSLARLTHFVECGPVTAFHQSTFQTFLPFPNLRWAWGTDVYWSELARTHNLRAGIIDATPITHLRPIAHSYSDVEAKAEGVSFLALHHITRPKTDILQTIQSYTQLP